MTVPAKSSRLESYAKAERFEAKGGKRKAESGKAESEVAAKA